MLMRETNRATEYLVGGKKNLKRVAMELHKCPETLNLFENVVCMLISC